MKDVEENGAVQLDVSQHDDLNDTMSSMSLTNAPPCFLYHPWVPEFRRQCTAAMRNRNPGALKNLIALFNRNINHNPEDYKIPWRAEILKKIIIETLLFFTYFYRFDPSQTQGENKSAYYSQMSDMLARYIDLELVASKDTNPSDEVSVKKILSRAAKLFMVFKDSPEFLLDTMLKLQTTSDMNKLYLRVLHEVIRKIFKILPAEPTTELMYARYLLVFRLWRMIHINRDMKKEIYEKAKKSLPQSISDDLQTLLEKVLPDAPTGAPTQQTKFHLNRRFDLRVARNNFLKYCEQFSKKNELPTACLEPKISHNEAAQEDEATKISSSNDTERDPRLKRDRGSIYSGLFKNNLDINIASSSTDFSIVTKIVLDKKNNKSPVLRKKNINRLRKNEIVTLDITGDQVQVIERLRKSNPPKWLENYRKRFLAGITNNESAEVLQYRNSTLKKTAETTNTKLISQKIHSSLKSEVISTVEDLHSIKQKLVPPASFTNSSTNPKSEDNLNEDCLDKRPKINILNFNSSPSYRPILKPICIGSDSNQLEENNDDYTTKDKEYVLKDFGLDKNNAIVTKSIPLKNNEKELKSSALRDINKKSTDSIKVLSVDALNDVSSTELKESKTEAKGSCSVIRRSISVTETSVVKNVEPKIFKEKPVNSILMKTDNPSEPKVQQALIIDKTNLVIHESHNCVKDNKLDRAENNNVNKKPEKAKSTLKETKVEKQTKENYAYVNSSQQSQTVSSSMSNDFYHNQGPEIDGLSLLANVSAELQRPELKFTPHSCLQRNPKDDEKDFLIRQLTDTPAENDDVDDKLNQFDNYSSEYMYNLLNKQQQQDGLSNQDAVLFEETRNKILEGNGSFISDGETVTLKRSPYPDLFVINKAKFSRNEAPSVISEDNKCFQQGMLLKHEFDDPYWRSRSIKYETDNSSLKFNPLIHDDIKLNTQDLFCHHSVRSPAVPVYSQSNNYLNNICSPLCPLSPHYHLNHITQPLQVNSAVQEVEAEMLKIHESGASFHTVKKNILDDKKSNEPKPSNFQVELLRDEVTDTCNPNQSQIQCQIVDFDELSELKQSKVVDIESSCNFENDNLENQKQVQIQTQIENEKHSDNQVSESKQLENILLPPKKRYLSLMPDTWIPSLQSSSLPVSFGQNDFSDDRSILTTSKYKNQETSARPFTSSPLPSSAKNPRKSRTTRVIKQTRAAVKKRAMTAVTEETDPEWSPSNKRKKKRSSL